MIYRSYQALGGICLIKQKDRKRAKEILTKHKRFRSVYYHGKISGIFRKPDVQWLAGEKNTFTKVRENGCDFVMDISHVMFSKGNQQEKRRIVQQITGKENVLDMFVGIGYFTIPLAKLTPAKVWAIDLSKGCIEFLKQNLKLNKVEDKVTVIQGDSNIEALAIGKKFDRVHMGYFPGTYAFLPTALKVCKKNGIIHFHEIAETAEQIEEEIKKIASIEKRKIKIITRHKVKEYGAKKWHWVLDLQKTK
jgi:tRNA wybutosine-synthesizing protein 2